jgi:hypothetical protein
VSSTSSTLVRARRSVPAAQAAKPYRYKSSRPFSVFALAAVATVGVLGMTFGAYSALTEATEQERIAPPPNLKKVVPGAKRAAGKLAHAVATMGAHR